LEGEREEHMKLITMKPVKQKLVPDKRYRQFKNHVSDNMILVKELFATIQDALVEFPNGYKKDDRIAVLAEIGIILCDRMEKMPKVTKR
jgi:hypothetical protein